MTVFTSSEMQAPNVPTTDSAACSPAPLCNIDAEKHSPQKKEHKCHKCIVCLKEFKRNVSLKDHMSIHTGVLTTRVKTKQEHRHKCMVCEKRFRSPYAMKQHMNVHTGMCNYACRICGKKFFQRRNLQNHSLTHSTDRPHECKLCTSTFKRPHHLANHMFCVHERKQKIKYSDSNRYYFPYDGSDMRHANKNHVGDINGTDEKPFKCKLCDAQFIQCWSLSVHVNTVHLDKRPYLCSICGKTFKSNSALQTHSVIHMEARKVSAECNVCQKMVKINAMYIHMKSHEEKKFLCNFCGKRFSLKHQLSNHEKSHLGLKAHACELCDRRFTLPHQLRAHRKTHSESKKEK
ncbi:zinc finger protein 879-like [Haliotis rubra]|uniref:zinc finger protein 879-like n=1 Tax=Haliotis rubra TaxID=36100 RepID=UPI001EE57031|nr:zinc finger protein 879-like [Haliotis rubra]XP_046571558.1 zinc finger protein 879-like [Haliotis rubra]XP_046571559.1 zinc finger protein 879-like [Haliotis rubra]XP_046571560.1 zinc finger protein 879-like [Haliotis rubra]